MSKRRNDRWEDAAMAWGMLGDPTSRVVLWMTDGTPRIVARRSGVDIPLLASPTWETVAELLIRAATELRRK